MSLRYNFDLKKLLELNHVVKSYHRSTLYRLSSQPLYWPYIFVSRPGKWRQVTQAVEYFKRQTGNDSAIAWIPDVWSLYWPTCFQCPLGRPSADWSSNSKLNGATHNVKTAVKSPSQPFLRIAKLFRWCKRTRINPPTQHRQSANTTKKLRSQNGLLE